MGLPEGLFANPEAARQFACSVCNSIADKPRILQPCEHVFCKKCAESLTGTCPIDHETYVTKRELGHLALRMYNGLQVMCERRGHGCEWIGTVGELEKHFLECPAAPVHCPLSEQCGSMSRKDLKHHLTVCPKRQVTCDYCCITYLGKDQQAHEEQCEYAPVQFGPGKCTLPRSLLKQLVGMQSELVSTRSELQSTQERLRAAESMVDVRVGQVEATLTNQCRQLEGACGERAHVTEQRCKEVEETCLGRLKRLEKEYDMLAPAIDTQHKKLEARVKDMEVQGLVRGGGQASMPIHTPLDAATDGRIKQLEWALEEHVKMYAGRLSDVEERFGVRFQRLEATFDSSTQRLDAVLASTVQVSAALQNMSGSIDEKAEQAALSAQQAAAAALALQQQAHAHVQAQAVSQQQTSASSPSPLQPAPLPSPPAAVDNEVLPQAEPEPEPLLPSPWPPTPAVPLPAPSPPAAAPSPVPVPVPVPAAAFAPEPTATATAPATSGLDIAPLPSTPPPLPTADAQDVSMRHHTPLVPPASLTFASPTVLLSPGPFPTPTSASAPAPRPYSPSQALTSPVPSSDAADTPNGIALTSNAQTKASRKRDAATQLGYDDLDELSDIKSVITVRKSPSGMFNVIVAKRQRMADGSEVTMNETVPSTVLARDNPMKLIEYYEGKLHFRGKPA
mmetsp:Transcript_27535/g.44810  ORF Transcript_27535/g.44810 Transcript_27535/m.44810 type:complete len:677 (-) Transcript_27535:959-2989(-)|eukprot:CAMPEP_0184650554 /NCGR_PEP_ID=MMETSP0308-20130426/8090_1 /TAXON_ID=38269 /ORGANISM="Gloeochaete witrockiana, Strain SAG 46.84" /LENGTH=676 /DNA_ID=CAMNT_0027084161 /DNA_START=58 /DNA_END=2088 /DNA_ORIENTATION=-